MALSEMQMGQEMTIKEYISNYQSEDIRFSEFFLKEVLVPDKGEKILVNFSNLIIKYMPELKSLKIKVTLTNDEYERYKFNPKRLAYDIYGNTELWFLILEANELKSAIDFDLKTLYLFQTSIVDKMSRILNLELVSKDFNIEEISEKLNS